MKVVSEPKAILNGRVVVAKVLSINSDSTALSIRPQDDLIGSQDGIESMASKACTISHELDEEWLFVRTSRACALFTTKNENESLSYFSEDEELPK